MKKIEKILIVMVVIGQLMRILDISGGEMISIISGAVLVLFYLFFGVLLLSGLNFKELFKSKIEKKRTTIVFSILTGTSLAICVSGIILKLHIITDANLNLIMGILLLIFTFGLIRRFGNNNQIKSFNPPRLIVYGVVSLFLLIIPYRWLVDVFYFRNPDRADLIKERLKDDSDLDPNVEK